MTALLSFDQVAGIRRGETLFEDMSFALSPGKALLVTGPNGAGKSTLIRIAAGLLRPGAGRVVRRGRTALLAETAALDAGRSVAEALVFWARLGGRAHHVAAALDELGLTALGDVPVRMLSTGQRRRVAMARVVASAAPLWLLDEPANGLDAAAAALLEALIARHRAGGGAVVVATHLPVALPDAVPLMLGAAA
ncbi:heme ABC exporter ATP-binding protein CcmA [uncultured Sphingomonas sp.]|uniref:heme ABC exporter ATP-binding protein CcmA n=1 Tax=uncultured Sphingomonas sp. TaxID=158754 RepID=UPI0035CBED0B